ncbi:MAG: hypothetical protein IJU72_05815 [Bacteroidales bacterium]|nr:hypothetical protein [Bacteroidales bacterium]
MNDKPQFVTRDGMIADREYVAWLHELKARFHSCQLKAAVRINSSMLEFYWSLGRRHRQEKS